MRKSSYNAFLQALPSPRFFKSHTSYDMMPGGEPAKSPSKYIYVARNPKDTAVSMYHHVRNFKSFDFDGPWDGFYEEFMNGRVESGLWFDHVLQWWKHDGELVQLSVLTN